MRVIDLNADLGEGVGDDEALLRVVTSANIATGAHAGGDRVLQRAVRAAVAGGVSVGAHPSYRDRSGFGRASRLAALQADATVGAAIARDLVEQVLTVARVAERAGAPLTHVKAHGALYNEAVADLLAARVVLDAVHAVADRLGYPIAVLSQPHGQLAQLARVAGSPLIAEGFVDRGYEPSGRLVPRGRRGDLHDSVAAMVAQALDLAAGRVRSVDGEAIDLDVGSMCVHGDTPDAVGAARAVHAALLGAGWQVTSPWARTDAATAHGPSAQASRAAATGPDHLATPALGAPCDGDLLPDSGVRDTGASAPPQVHLAPPAAGSARSSDRDDPRSRIRALPFGDRAVLLEPLGHPGPATEWVLRVAARARAAWPGVEVVAGLASVLVVFDQPTDRPVPAHVAARLTGAGAQRSTTGSAPRTPRAHRIDVHYDGPDLADLAHAVGVDVHELAARHAAATWTVAAVGFSPGFGYLTSSDPIFDAVERRANPRSRVPAGSLALAAGMCAVYPSQSPGGWQLIGRTDAVLFDVRADRPALLGIGDVVTFAQVQG